MTRPNEPTKTNLQRVNQALKAIDSLTPLAITMDVVSTENDRLASDVAVWESRYGAVHEQADELEARLKLSEKRTKDLCDAIDEIRAVTPERAVEAGDCEVRLSEKQVVDLMMLARATQKAIQANHVEPPPPVEHTPMRSFAFTVHVGGEKREGGTLSACSMEAAAFKAAQVCKLDLVRKGTRGYTDRWEWTKDGKIASIGVWAHSEDDYFTALRGADLAKPPVTAND